MTIDHISSHFDESVARAYIQEQFIKGNYDLANLLTEHLEEIIKHVKF